ncbi:MAG: hypothetical protein AAF514_19280, partial [Verrucomicrobiota bacterium]
DGEAIQVRVVCDGDVLPADDEVMAWLPEADPLKVKWLASDRETYTGLALESMAATEEILLLAEHRSTDEADVVVIENHWPAGFEMARPTLVIGLGGEESGPAGWEGFSEMVTQSEIRVRDDRHPVLSQVARPRSPLGQTGLWKTKDLEALWQGNTGDVLLSAGKIEGERVVWMGFSPDRSQTFALTRSFPLLIGNAIFWLGEERRAELDFPILKTGTVMGWGDREGERPALLLRRTGLLETREGFKGSAVLCSRNESFVPRARDSMREATSLGSSYSLIPWLLGLVLVLVLVDARLFPDEGSGRRPS